MRFKLAPDNRNCPDDVLLEDLRQVAGRLKKPAITQDEYNREGRFSPATIKNRFATWNLALTQAGLDVKRRMNIQKSELLKDLRSTAKKHQTEILTTEQYKVNGQFSRETIIRTFGSWENAISQAGLKVSASWRPRIDNDRLSSNLAKVWESIGRQPKQSDLRPPLSDFTSSVYKRRFGSWRKALERFVELANENELPEEKASSRQKEEFLNDKPKHVPQKTPRDPSWKIRFLRVPSR